MGKQTEVESRRGLPRPVPTSDPWVEDKDNAPHLKDNKWITVLNTYAKGGAATVYRPGADLSLLKDSDIVVILEPEGNFTMSLHDAKAAEYPEGEYVTEWEARFRGLQVRLAHLPARRAATAPRSIRRTDCRNPGEESSVDGKWMDLAS